MTLTLQNFTFAVMSFFFNSSSHLYSLELVTFFFVIFSAVKSHYFSLILTQTHFVQHHFSHLFFYLCLVLLSCQCLLLHALVVATGVHYFAQDDFVNRRRGGGKEHYIPIILFHFGEEFGVCWGNIIIFTDSFKCIRQQ